MLPGINAAGGAAVVVGFAAGKAAAGAGAEAAAGAGAGAAEAVTGGAGAGAGAGADAGNAEAAMGVGGAILVGAGAAAAGAGAGAGVASWLTYCCHGLADGAIDTDPPVGDIGSALAVSPLSKLVFVVLAAGGAAGAGAGAAAVAGAEDGAIDGGAGQIRPPAKSPACGPLPPMPLIRGIITVSGYGWSIHWIKASRVFWQVPAYRVIPS